jgi:hypothetical protein
MGTDRRSWLAISFLALAGVLAGLAAGCEEEARIALPTHWEAAMKDVRVVAVMPLSDAAGEKNKGSGNLIVSALMGEAFKTPGLKVVERAQLDKVLGETDLAMALQDKAVAIKIGKNVGADVLIMGELTQYEPSQEYSKVSVLGVGGGGTGTTFRVGISVRAVDVKTGEIMYAKSGTGKDKDGYPKAIDQAAQEALKAWRQFYEAREKLSAPAAGKAK